MYAENIRFLTERDWSQESFQQQYGCHCVSFVMYIPGATFEEHCYLFPERFFI